MPVEPVRSTLNSCPRAFSGNSTGIETRKVVIYAETNRSAWKQSVEGCRVADVQIARSIPA